MRVSAHQCRVINHPFPLLAWLIMIFQKMKPWENDSYAHMAISYSDTFYDVSGKGYRVHSKGEFLKKYKIVKSHEFNLEISEEDFNQFSLSHKGKKYDQLQILGIALKMLGIISFNTLGRDFKRLICNELIISYLHEFHGLEFKDSDNFDLIDTWNKVKEY